MNTHDNIYGIQKSCYSTSNKTGEHFIKEHGICLIVSGEMEAFDGKEKLLYKKGDVILFRKNALIRFVKYAQTDNPFEAISLLLDDKLLIGFAQQHNITATQAPKESLFKISPDSLIISYFTGLKPYFDQEISQELATVKKEEIIHLLLRNHGMYKDILFNFSMPGKIDLEAFMNTNFRFNVPLSQFAFLTGRSLATFKRDFEKAFHNSPSRWIQQKRLEEAHFLLEAKKMKAKDVYLEVGFETLSHFSYSFKKHFGVTPSSI